MCSELLSRGDRAIFFTENLKAETYHDILENLIFPAAVDAVPMRCTRSNQDARQRLLKTEYSFQQDGASVHRTHENIQLIRESFNSVISKNGDIEWPPRSPDLSPLDYWLWGDVKSRMDSHEDVHSLKAQFSKIIAEINWDTIRKSIDSFPDRLRRCLQRDGDHIESHMHRAPRQTNSH